MKRNYESPEALVIVTEGKDVITTSVGDTPEVGFAF